MSTTSTVRMWYENLAAMSGNDRLPLSQLLPTSHVHGGLRLEIGGRLVPYMGYWGVDDVCFGQWLVELENAANALKHDGGRYVFDEGEQGQPAFVFERASSQGYFTIGSSEYSGEDGDPDWDRVEFSPTEFVATFEQLRHAFETEIMREAPANAIQWLARFRHVPGA